MGNNINKNIENLPSIYAFLGEGKVLYQKIKGVDKYYHDAKIVRIEKVLTKQDLQRYKNQLSNLRKMQQFKIENNLLLPLQQSFIQDVKQSMCSQNKICTLKYQFTNLQNTLEAQFLRRLSSNIVPQKTRDVRKQKQEQKIVLNKDFYKGKRQSYFQEDEIFQYFKAMVSTANVFHKWTNKSSNYKLSQMFVEADSLKLQISNCLTMPIFKSIYQQYLEDPNKINNSKQSKDLQYLAPQQWIYLKQRAQIKTCNKKSQIFIIGKNILKLMCLSSLSDLQNKNYFNQNLKVSPHKTTFGKKQKKDSPPDWYLNEIKRFYHQQVIQYYLNEASNRYSKQFVNLIKNMTDINYFARPSAQDILYALKTIEQKSQCSIYEKLIPEMKSERQSFNHSPQQKEHKQKNKNSSHHRKNTKTSSGEIISIGKSSRKKNYQKFICQTYQRQQIGCIPFQINAQMVCSQYVSFKQSARQSDFL